MQRVPTLTRIIDDKRLWIVRFPLTFICGQTIEARYVETTRRSWTAENKAGASDYRATDSVVHASYKALI